MLERFTPERVFRRARREGWQLASMARELPYQIHDTLEQVREGQINIGFVHKGLDELAHKLDAVAKQARDRADHHRRADRLELDRDLSRRPAHSSSGERDLGRRLSDSRGSSACGCSGA